MIKVLKGFEIHLSWPSVFMGSLESMLVLSSGGKFSIESTTEQSRCMDSSLCVW